MEVQRQVLHLYWRAGFGLSPQEWADQRHWTIERATREVLMVRPFREIPLPALPTVPGRMASREERMAFNKSSRQSMVGFNAENLSRLAAPLEDPLRERMALFWHDHFASEAKHAYPAVQQFNTLREHALGNFRDLLLAVSRDPVMIRFLNNQQNRKQSPNENFARELLELFTLGRGHYSETDIKEAARAFTGWSSNVRNEFVFRERAHDFGEKVFLGRRGKLGGEDIIDVILEQSGTATFLVRKIYRYFVNEAVDEARIVALADHFRRSDYDIRDLMRRIFTSNWFYDSQNVGTKIKSPLDFLVGLIRHLQVTDINPTALVGVQRALGQVLYRPPNVAGWPGGKSWIDNATLMVRLQLPKVIYEASELDFGPKSELDNTPTRRLRRLEARVNLEPLRSLSSGQPPTEAAAQLSRFLLTSAQSPAPAVLDAVTRSVHSDARFTALALAIMSSPEYQLC